MTASSAPRTLFASDALLPTGWARNVLLSWNASGQLIEVLTNVDPQSGEAGEVDAAVRASGPVIPGMPNLHSHAFQRAFGGLTEFRGQAQDSFWSWRNLMYRFAARITPESLEAIATWLYVEMLEAGYTSVCEFHYVHHDQDGTPYADDATLSLALLRAAQKTGIGMTLLPVLYRPAVSAASPRAKTRHALFAAPTACSPCCSSLSLRCALKAPIWVWHRIRCVPCHPIVCKPPLPACTPCCRKRLCTSTLPSKRKRWTTASPGAASAPCSGCWSTRRWTSAGA